MPAHEYSGRPPIPPEPDYTKDAEPGTVLINALVRTKLLSYFTGHYLRTPQYDRECPRPTVGFFLKSIANKKAWLPVA